MDDVERAARGEALARMANRFATVNRRRSPVEAPRELTDAYVALIVACGFGRLGDAARVASAIAAARAVLSPLHDPVHDFLLDAFVARATDDRAALATFTARHVTLDRVTRYKVDRLLEASILLDPSRTVNPIFDSRRGIARSRSLRRRPCASCPTGFMALVAASASPPRCSGKLRRSGSPTSTCSSPRSSPRS